MSRRKLFPTLRFGQNRRAVAWLHQAIWEADPTTAQTAGLARSTRFGESTRRALAQYHVRTRSILGPQAWELIPEAVRRRFLELQAAANTVIELVAEPEPAPDLQPVPTVTAIVTAPPIQPPPAVNTTRRSHSGGAAFLAAAIAVSGTAVFLSRSDLLQPVSAVQSNRALETTATPATTRLNVNLPAVVAEENHPEAPKPPPAVKDSVPVAPAFPSRGRSRTHKAKDLLAEYQPLPKGQVIRRGYRQDDRNEPRSDPKLVAWVQAAANVILEPDTPFQEDGKFGKGTSVLVRDLQHKLGAEANRGDVGRGTYGAIHQALERVSSGQVAFHQLK